MGWGRYRGMKTIDPTEIRTDMVTLLAIENESSEEFLLVDEEGEFHIACINADGELGGDGPFTVASIKRWLKVKGQKDSLAKLLATATGKLLTRNCEYGYAFARATRESDDVKETIWIDRDGRVHLTEGEFDCELSLKEARQWPKKTGIGVPFESLLSGFLGEKLVPEQEVLRGGR